MSEQNDGGPAFPVPRDAPVDGMSLRDYFAAKAMAAMLSIEDVHLNAGEIKVAVWAYSQADAMLAERKKHK